MKILVHLAWLIFIAGLTGCGAKKSNGSVMQNAVPSWVLNPSVKEGAVCSQDRGIYPLAKAESIAINNCVLQLADKRITGQTQVSKDVQVHTSHTGENIRTKMDVKNAFEVKAADGSQNIAYEIRGKYYDPVQQKVHVWIVLK